MKGIIKKVELENGMTVLIKENDLLPIVTIQALFLGGLRFESSENNGICNFMVKMLLSGSESKTKAQIAEEIDSRGGYLEPMSGNNSFGLLASVLSRDFEATLNLMSDLVQHPIFSPKEFEKQRKETLSEIKSTKDDWLYETRNLFKKTLYIQHPYRFPIIGSTQSLKNLTAESVKDFYGRYCLPNNIVLAIFGDVHTDRAIYKIESDFGDFLRRPLLTPQVPAEPEIETERKVEKSKKLFQAAIYIGYPTISLSHPDSYPLQVMDAILSGISYPGGRLHNKLREEQIVYMVHAYNQMGLDPGYFAIYAATTPDKLPLAMDIIDREIESVRKEKVDEDELERGKRMCIASLQIGMQTNFDQALSCGLNELYQLGYDHDFDYEVKINSVTSDDLIRIANLYFRTERKVTAILKPFKPSAVAT